MFLFCSSGDSIKFSVVFLLHIFLICLEDTEIETNEIWEVIITTSLRSSQYIITYVKNTYEQR